MTTAPRLVGTRRVLIATGCVVSLAALLAAAGDSAQAGAAVGPDVTVFDFTDIHSYGSSGGFAAYAIGTNACNRGDAPLNWCESGGCAPGAGPEDHPVIAQNLYRLKSGRFEQIGMSWLKHGFASLNGTHSGCSGSCQPPPAGSTQLGVGCIDPYFASTNGTRAFMGPRSEVNATTGVFPYPPSFPPGPYEIYDQRIKVATADVDSTLNPGATYWAEAHYVASDDASAANAFNNASHRRVTVGGAPGYNLSMTESFVEGQPAILAWPAQDPTVELAEINISESIPGSIVQRFHAARKVTDLGGGTWHYEYAVHNLSSDRAARAFSVEFPLTTHFTNVGFKDIEHHSGEPYATDDWSVFSSGGQISWSTDTFAADPNANALRWSTLFNFWFDADRPPAAIVHTLELFKPGDPASIEFAIGNGIFSDGFESGDTDAWGFVSGGT